MILVYWILSFKSTFLLSSFAFIKRIFSSSSLSAIRVVSSAYLRLLIFLPAFLIPACASSRLVFLMIYSAVAAAATLLQSCPTLCNPIDDIFCRPLLLLPSIFPSIRIFSNESVLCIRWPKYCSFTFNITPFNDYSGLISFRMDWWDLLAVQGTLKSLLQTTVQKHQFCTQLSL